MVTVLMMAVVLAVLGLSAMNTGVLQERMAGHARDRNVALQSAEAGLRDAEADILANLDAASAFGPACDRGLCVPPSMAASGATSTPAWQTVTWDEAHTRRYGQYTGAAALPDVAAQPTYLVEILPALPPGAGTSANLGGRPGQQPQPFRITVRATGRQASTVVMLQSTYLKQ